MSIKTITGTNKRTYTATQIKNAGKTIRTLDLSKENRVKLFLALDILNYWRSLHNIPLNTFQSTLRSKINVLKLRNAVVVQRVKRTPSIVKKLRRFSSMDLFKMQDIGGLRAILKTTSEVYELSDHYKNSNFRHELIKEYDYIKEPKESGYRGLHFVYRYYTKNKPQYSGLLIEIQIRTNLQHSWATAVEIIGTFLEQSLKSSEGPAKYLEFFELASAAFATIEKAPLPPQFTNWSERKIKKELKKSADKLNIIKTLEGFTVTTHMINKKSKEDHAYYLLEFYVLKQEIVINTYTRSELSKATSDYLHLEKKFKEQNDVQVVLASTSSLKSLKKAYPNYFMDTHVFISDLTSFLEG